MDIPNQHPLNRQMVNPNGLKQACSSCSLRELCLPIGLDGEGIDKLDHLVSRRRHLRRGDHAFRVGNQFQFLYAIRTGFFKTYELQEDGQEHITGFHMTGEIIGMDAISSDHNTCNAVALEDSDLCEIPFSQLESLCREIPALQHQFHKLMSREIIRDHGIMMLLGGMRAEERLAAFLLNLSQRYAARGYSATQFHLRMTRAEIGHYLGMKLETVSRTLTRFQELGMITVNNKFVELHDAAKLRQLMNREECANNS